MSNGDRVKPLEYNALSALAGLFTLTVGDNTNMAFTLTSSANDTLTFTIDSEADLFRMMSRLFRLPITQVLPMIDLSDATNTLQKTLDFTQGVVNNFIPPIPSTTASETYEERQRSN